MIKLNLLRPFIPPKPEELTREELYSLACDDLEDHSTTVEVILDTAWEGGTWTFSLEDERIWYSELDYPTRWEVYQSLWENQNLLQIWEGQALD